MDYRVYAEDLARRLRPDEERAVLDAWLDFAFRRNTGPFQPPHRTRSLSKLDWPEIPINDALDDQETMVLSQLCNLNRHLTEGTCLPLCIRPNYGVGNTARMLGAKPFRMERKLNCLPNVYPIGEAGVRRLLDGPEADFTGGDGPAIFACGERYLELFRQYPELGEFVLTDHPDLQGPMDNLELLWGSDMFYALYDDPDTIHASLNYLTEFYIRFLERWLALMSNRYGVACYFHHVVPGAAYLRDDSAMNLSPAGFREFIAPYDSRILARFGGGVHFCGRGEHFIEQLARYPRLGGVNMSQPHLNDMEIILRCTADAGIPLTSLPFPIDPSRHRMERIFMQ